MRRDDGAPGGDGGACPERAGRPEDRPLRVHRRLRPADAGGVLLPPFSTARTGCGRSFRKGCGGWRGRGFWTRDGSRTAGWGRTSERDGTGPRDRTGPHDRIPACARSATSTRRWRWWAGGRRGMAAALAAAECGLRVCLFERRGRLGGHLDWRVREFEGEPLWRRGEGLTARLPPAGSQAAENVKVFTSSPVTGVWGENLLTGFHCRHRRRPLPRVPLGVPREGGGGCGRMHGAAARLQSQRPSRGSCRSARPGGSPARMRSCRGKAAVFSVGDDLSLGGCSRSGESGRHRSGRRRCAGAGKAGCGARSGAGRSRNPAAPRLGGPHGRSAGST